MKRCVRHKPITYSSSLVITAYIEIHRVSFVRHMTSTLVTLLSCEPQREGQYQYSISLVNTVAT